MSAIELPHEVVWQSLLSAATPSAISCGVGLAALLITLVYRTLAEWQRRETLVALLENAPDGTVIVQARHSGRAAMWVHVGQRTVDVRVASLPPARSRP